METVAVRLRFGVGGEKRRAARTTDYIFVPQPFVSVSKLVTKCVIPAFKIW